MLVILDYSLVLRQSFSLILMQPNNALYIFHHHLSIDSTEYDIIPYLGFYFFHALLAQVQCVSTLLWILP